MSVSPHWHRHSWQCQFYASVVSAAAIKLKLYLLPAHDVTNATVTLTSWQWLPIKTNTQDTLCHLWYCHGCLSYHVNTETLETDTFVTTVLLSLSLLKQWNLHWCQCRKLWRYDADTFPSKTHAVTVATITLTRLQCRHINTDTHNTDTFEIRSIAVIVAAVTLSPALVSMPWMSLLRHWHFFVTCLRYQCCYRHIDTLSVSPHWRWRSRH